MNRTNKYALLVKRGSDLGGHENFAERCWNEYNGSLLEYPPNNTDLLRTIEISFYRLGLLLNNTNTAVAPSAL